MARVFFVHPVKQDVTQALEYGDPVYIGADYVFPDSIDNERVPDDVWLRMRAVSDEQFDPEHDFLAIVGDHLQLVLLTGILMQRHAAIKVLRWDRNAKGYLPVTLVGYPGFAGYEGADYRGPVPA